MVHRRKRPCGLSYTPEQLDSIPITRSLLKKLAQAKCVPEIYKEVWRSQHRKSKVFHVKDHDIRRRTPSSCSKRSSAEEKNSDVDGNPRRNAQFLDSETSDNGNEILYTDTDEESVNQCFGTSNTSEDLKEVTEHKELNGQTSAMRPKVSSVRKSVNSEARPPGSPGVITRSQLRQLANNKNVPEEYRDVVEVMSTPKRNQKHDSVIGVTKKQSSQRKSVNRKEENTPPSRRRRSSLSSNSENIADKSNEVTTTANMTSNENICSEEQCDINAHLENSASNDHKIAPNSSGGDSKNVKGNRSDFCEVLQETSENKHYSAQDKTELILSKGFGLKKYEENSGTKSKVHRKARKQTINVSVKDISVSLGSDITVDSSITENLAAARRNNAEGNKKLFPVSASNSYAESDSDSTVASSPGAAKSKAGERESMNNNSTKALPLSGRITSEEEMVSETTTVKRSSSICEPVDMSISEGCSGTDKISYLISSKTSDSETSETSTKCAERSMADISQKKSEIFKQESVTSYKLLKNSEASCVTSSSYNSGHEITPSKMCVTSESKDCSISTKTTDSGVTGTFDSNQYFDSDSSSTGNSTYNLSSVKTTDFNKSANVKKVNLVQKSSPSIISQAKKLSPKSGVKTPAVAQSNLVSPASVKTFQVGHSTDIPRIRPPIIEEASESDSDAESRKAIMLSAQRRIELNLSTTDSDSRRNVPHQIPPPTLDGEDSDDAPPDSMTFESARSNAAESLRDAVESIRRDRQRRKEKRRARLEKLRQQKEEKLIRLKERLASQEDASCSSSEESGYEEEEARHFKKKPTSREKLRRENYNKGTKFNKKIFDVNGESVEAKTLKGGHQKMEKQHIQNSSSGSTKRLPDELLERLSEKAPVPNPPKMLRYENTGDIAGDKTVPTATRKRKKKSNHPNKEINDGPSDMQSFKKPCSLDYIPLKTSSTTKFAIVPLDKMGKTQKSTAQKAAEFRQNVMFGNHHKREPANTSLIYLQKLQASGKNVFARKN